jgi:hypothetical protein
MRRDLLIPLAIILAIGCFFILTLRPGHRWGDDFAMYLLHARNIANGLPYSTGYIYNAAEPHTGQPAYPPVFPLLLVPAYKIAGLNYPLLKGIEVVTFLVALWAMFVVSSRYLTWPWRIGLLLLIGLQPFVWDKKDDITSDIPFLMFLYLGIALAGHFYDRPAKETPVWAGVLAGILMYLSYGTRSVGLAIIPALLFYDVLKRRRITRFGVIAVGVAGLLAAAQAASLRGTNGSDRFGLFDFSPAWLISNTIAYFKSLRVFLLNGYSNSVSYAVFGVAILLALWGAWYQLRRGVHLLELFSVIYMGLIIAYPVPGLQRYLLPVMPLFFIYVLTGLRELLAAAMPPLRIPIAGAAVLLIAMTYAGAYAKTDWGPIREGINDPDFVDACQYLRKNAAPGDIVMFRKPRILALLTGLPAVIYSTTAGCDAIRADVHQFHARYIVTGDVSHEDFASDAQQLRPCLERYKDSLDEVHANSHYRIFTLRPGF